MTKRRKKEMIRKAIEKDELDLLFLGYEEYYIGQADRLPVEKISDIEFILKSGLYEFYKNGDENIPEILTKTIYGFIEGNVVEIWVAFSIFCIQFFCEKTEECPFEITNDKMLESLKIAIEKQKEELSACFLYAGGNKKSGLYEDIEEKNREIFNQFNIKII